MKFELLGKTKEGIRRGRITTQHGVIDTPFFMPVGTVGSVKGVSPDELREMGAQIVLSNTYHLYLRPGEKLIKELGGLHEFMRWDAPILTDSGGYQVFSLGKKLDNNQETRNNNQTNSKSPIKNGNKGSLVRITEEGVEFTSHLDGSKHFFTPEKVIDIQLDLGVDILMPLDVCPSGKASKSEIEEAVRLTILWAKRAKEHFDSRIKPNPKVPSGNTKFRIKPALFGIVQGGLDAELRKYCANELIKLDFDGYSIGGLAVDHETRDMWDTVELMGEVLPQDKPRYLMGVGTPNDITKAVKLGVDMFDCVLPTRLARHGSVYTRKQRSSMMQDTITKQINNSKDLKTESQQQKADGYELINLLNSKYRTDGKVIEDGCDCLACRRGFSRAYISHLIRSGEMLGLRLASIHNLRQYLRMMENFRSDDIC